MLLELFNNLFMNVAEQTGAVLQNTVDEREHQGAAGFLLRHLRRRRAFLVANAPHVPVHLGAMGESVRTVLSNRRDTLKPGDVVALNNPFNGGTHLPDVTVITPVFDEAGARHPVLRRQPRPSRRYRRHHARLDAARCRARWRRKAWSSTISCWSMAGTSARPELRALLAGAKYPARSPDVNVADIKAQVAANEKGVQELQRVVAQYGWPTVSAYMRHVMDNAEEIGAPGDRPHRQRLVRLHDGQRHAAARRGQRRSRQRAAPSWISPAPARRARATSTRRRR